MRKTLRLGMLLVSTLACAMLASCSGDNSLNYDGGLGDGSLGDGGDAGDSGEDGSQDGAVDADADTDGDADGDGDTNCTFPGSFESDYGGYSLDSQNGGHVLYQGASGIATNYVIDMLNVELWETYGATIAPGQISLTGKETSYATCGTCVVFYEGVHLSGGNITSSVHAFMPQSGTLNLTSATASAGTKFAGTLNASLVEVTIDPTTSETTPVSGGCTIPINGFTFSVTLEAM